KQAAYGIGKIKKLDTLLRLVRRTATKSVGISHCSIYLIEDKNETTDPVFNLTHTHDSLPSRIKIFTSIVDTIKSYTEPFIIEEVLYNKGHKDEERNMAQFLQELHPEVVIPIVQSDNLLALILLGKKTNNSLYTNDDLTVFSILGNQAGVAIENCLFLESEKDRLKREGVHVRRESLDMMVSTMAHEIDNPIASVVMSADILKEEIEDMDKSNLPDYNLGLIQRAIKSVVDDSFRVSKIIKAVREYSKGSDGDLNPMLIYEILDSYRTLFILIKKDFEGVDYTEEIEENLPHIYAEPILIEEILVNFAKNAFQAVRHNKNGKKVTLRIYKKNDDYVRIEVQDNGSGITPKILKQLYEVPTTTKGSAEGTGIGLYRVRQICEILKAKYGAESEGEGKGALMYVEIPIYKRKLKK
ncbi:MAG TPA: GAF domain-containing sensor histidine kinase, partial [Chryseolinea sp.]|nr:GAF domain-containing sensor histidine kinase [Chryseolinea sp.]